MDDERPITPDMLKGVDLSALKEIAKTQKDISGYEMGKFSPGYSPYIPPPSQQKELALGRGGSSGRGIGQSITFPEQSIGESDDLLPAGKAAGAMFAEVAKDVAREERDAAVTSQTQAVNALAKEAKSEESASMLKGNELEMDGAKAPTPTPGSVTSKQQERTNEQEVDKNKDKDHER